jgi:hypothetical protein
MRAYLLTVESSSQTGNLVRVLPTVPIQRLPADMYVPMRGDELELHLPDGRVQRTSIGGFGVELWRDEEGNFWTTSDPAHPVLTLTIAGDLRAEDVPPGTEVWLSEARHKTPTQSP